MRLIPLFILVVIASAVWSCGKSYTHEQVLDVPDTGWAYQDSLLATFDIADTAAIYDLHLLLEHGEDFPHQNFYVRIVTRFPDGQALSENLSLELANPSGMWLGECSSGGCQIDIPIQTGAYFSQPGSYQISIAQFSRNNPLLGVRRVTFALEEMEARR